MPSEDSDQTTQIFVDLNHNCDCEHLSETMFSDVNARMFRHFWHDLYYKPMRMCKLWSVFAYCRMLV